MSKDYFLKRAGAWMDLLYVPKIICLCGSAKFYKLFEEYNYKFTLEGYIVLSIGYNTKSDKGLEITEEQKKMLDELHKRKIDLADEVFIINKDGYIGESTRSEIEYANKKEKNINYMEDIFF